MIQSTADCWFILCQVVTDDGLRYLPLGARNAHGMQSMLTPDVTIPFVYASERLATEIVRNMKRAGAPIFRWEVLHSSNPTVKNLLTTIQVSAERCILHPGESVVRVLLDAHRQGLLTGKRHTADSSNSYTRRSTAAVAPSKALTAENVAS